MRSITFVVAAAGLPFSAHAQLSPTVLCGDLSALEREVSQSNYPQRLTVFSGPRETACGSTTATQATFCSAVLAVIGIEYPHAFPWSVVGCLKKARLDPLTEEVDQNTGTNRKTIIRLAGVWPDGVRIDIQYTPTGDYNAYRGYYGRYEMVAWKPSIASRP